MSIISAENRSLKGGEFLIKSMNTSEGFFPEDFTEEHNMIIETVRDFISKEIVPNIAKMEKQEDNIAGTLLEKFGALGFIGTQIPEEYGGMDMDFNTNTIIGFEIGNASSFSVTYNAHTGIGMLPILYFGTKEQKDKYLPKMVAGEIKAAYCLTEPSSGSDALSAKSTAVLSADGSHYILNGQKMWITNAGFADVFTVFAQVPEHGFTGFIVEKGMEGFTLGEEEEKLGIKGSSTRQVYFENVKLPANYLLGKLGKGHKIAFNVLNTGRFKLGAAVVGGSSVLTAESVKYAKAREQFGKPIFDFGAIKHKLAEQATRTFASESALYRCSSLINDRIALLKSEGVDTAMAKLQAAEEYAIECSIIKIDGSESLDYVVDETVQIYGGMGYSEEGFAARAYRDARINRIFEGTNEINRMVIMSSILKRAMKGELDITTPALTIQSELTEVKEANYATDGSYPEEAESIQKYKKVLLMLLGTAAQKAMGGKLDLKEEQEILMNLSDIVIHIFLAESIHLRVSRMKEKGHQDLSHVENMMQVSFHEFNSSIHKFGIDAISALVSPAKQSDFVYALRKYTTYPLKNTKELRRYIANEL
ncbi:MAG TPA: acyl-CoA dehydrogenase [Saprospirales bacterium]|nr:acyl-CoA dehydrogenase [Saprospirales bacterium]